MVNPNDRGTSDLQVSWKKPAETDSAFGKTKPTGRPKSDFKKLLEEQDEDESEQKITTAKKGKGTTTPFGQEATQPVLDSPMAMYKQSAMKNKAAKQNLAAEIASSEGAEKSMTKNEAKRPSFSQEYPDLSAVNPNASSVVGITASELNDGFENQEVAATSNLKEIVSQIIDKIYTLKSEGKTDTVMTLQHPPIFAGATLTVTSFDSARGEFNVSFSNLTPLAKEMLDMQQAQHSLRTALEEKGYTLHILVITTTDVENRIDFTDAQPDDNQQGQRDQGEREQQEQKG